MADYNPNGLNMVTSLAPQIQTAAGYFGVSPLAIAGAIAQEETNQSASFLNETKAFVSTSLGDFYLGDVYASAAARSCFLTQRLIALPPVMRIKS